MAPGKHMKFCINCKHHKAVLVPRRRYSTSGMWWWREEHYWDEYSEDVCTIPVMNAVNGSVSYPETKCSWRRSEEGGCGPDGKLYEERS